MKISRWWLFGGAVLVAVIIYAGIKHQNKEDSSGLLKPANKQVVINGKKLYDANCSSCHGDQLQGQSNWKSRNAQGYLPAPPHDSSGHTWHHSEKLLFSITKNGPGNAAGKNYKTTMPKYSGILKDEEIIAVLSYIKSTWPPEIRKQNDFRSQ